MGRPVEISGVVITKNEEKNIGRCLRSMDNVCDEIFVLDSGSTDRTREIAESFPKVKFLNVAWEGFAKTKNNGNDMAKGMYILSMDADEELSSELQSEILQVKKSPFSNEAYFINRMTNYCGKWIYHSGWNPDFQLRLFPKAGSEWVGDHVHETLSVQPTVSKKYFENYAYHYSYYTIEEHVARINKYSTLGQDRYHHLPRKLIILRMVINPPLRFFKSYVLKKGFLDGFEGFVIATLTATAV
ncbi:MAG: glycosyltransferase family 2 protein, partial [Pseudobdellovibrionaceae bacterium]